MAAQSSGLDDQKSEVIIEMEGYTLTPPKGQKGLKEMEASGSIHHIHHPSLQ